MLSQNLEGFINLRAKEKKVLIMSHTVIGYPNLDHNRELIANLVQAGADIIELQFPFTDPIADGPILLKANQCSVENNTTIDQCFSFAREMTKQYPQTAFVIMTYYNIVFSRGIRNFVLEAADAGLLGMIIPDCPPEEGSEYLEACRNSNFSPILLVTPDTSNERIQWICDQGMGLLYCVARKGVTGRQTLFDPEFDAYIKRVRQHSKLPLGVGFGIRKKEDVDYLAEKVDVVIICSRVIQLSIQESPKAAGEFLAQVTGNQ